LQSNNKDDANDGLDHIEREEARRRTAPKAAIVYEAIRGEGAVELERNVSALVWSGLAAGLAMGFSFLSEALLVHHLPEAEWVPLLSKFGYSIGFLIVVLGRQQLFTEDTLTAILPLLSHWNMDTGWKVLRLWSAVLGANLIGAFTFALLITGYGHFEFRLNPELHELAQKSMATGFASTFLSAVFAGWLIALMVWLLPFAETGRVTIIIIITYLIGLGGFAHIIAGSVNAIYIVINSPTTIFEFLMRFFLPTLMGNVVGGVGFVAILNHAQVIPDRVYAHTERRMKRR